MGLGPAGRRQLMGIGTASTTCAPWTSSTSGGPSVDTGASITVGTAPTSMDRLCIARDGRVWTSDTCTGDRPSAGWAGPTSSSPSRSRPQAASAAR